MSNVGRVLTLVVRILDAEQAEAIWNTHVKNELLAGCKITTIAEGNAVKDLELHEQYASYIYSVYDGLSFAEWKEENV